MALKFAHPTVVPSVQTRVSRGSASLSASNASNSGSDMAGRYGGRDRLFSGHPASAAASRSDFGAGNQLVVSATGGLPIPTMTRTSSDRRTGGTIRRRVLAYLVDVVAVLGGAGLLSYARGRRLSVRNAVRGFLVAALAAGPYHVLLEGGPGQTVGKRTLRLAVEREDGSPSTYRAALTRTLYRFVDWVPAAYGLGLVSMLLDGRDRRLGDRAAGTVVVRTDGADASETAGDRA